MCYSIIGSTRGLGAFEHRCEVPFPNPEEKGALDMAIALAEKTGADVVLANDPDADRLAVAEREGSGWRVLKGDEVGILLADWASAASWGRRAERFYRLAGSKRCFARR